MTFQTDLRYGKEALGGGWVGGALASRAPDPRRPNGVASSKLAWWRVAVIERDPRVIELGV
jgi:hypothetical protein